MSAAARTTFLRAFVAAELAMALGASRARACPNCVTSRLVRDELFDGTFWTKLGLVLLPLIFLSAISALLYRIGLAPDAAKSKETRT